MEPQNLQLENMGRVQNELFTGTQIIEDPNTAVSGGYNAVVNNVYGENTHTPAPAYHSERAEVLSDMEATTANN